MAVELAVLHNFFWHQRWTWRDRPSRGPAESWRRLARFHAANGLVSLAGNVLITTALVQAGLSTIPANFVATLACSLVNYVAGDLVVFRALIVVLTLTAGAGGPCAPINPRRRSRAGTAMSHRSSSGSQTRPALFFTLDVCKVDRWRSGRARVTR